MLNDFPPMCRHFYLQHCKAKANISLFTETVRLFDH